MAGDAEDQADELVALSSIYEEPIFTAEEDQRGGQFLVNIQVPEDFAICVDDEAAEVVLKTGLKPAEENGQSVLPISFVPPVILNFHYPADYPSRSAPDFTLSCKWLSPNQLSKLCSQLDDLWTENEGAVILFLWIQFLQDESFAFLNLSSPFSLDYSYVRSFQRQGPTSKKTPPGDLNGASIKGSDSKVRAEIEDSARETNPTSEPDSRAIQDVASIGNLISSIIHHNLEGKARAFNASFYHCQICFDEKVGADCTQYQICGHVYCKDCIGEYFKVHITDGNVKGLTCPQEKCDSQAIPSQVRALVNGELFARYDRLLLQHSLDGMDDIINCPRTTCSCPVMKEKDSNMAVCTSCHFAFCTLCNMAYHGVSPCRIRKDEIKNLRKEYENGDPETREALEKKYGRRILKRLMEDSISEQWVLKHSKKCPSCGSNIQKIDGCNKMHCMKCHTFFCWLCMKCLSKANPYQHFRDMSSKCYNLLFQGLQGTGPGDDDADHGFGDDDDDLEWLDAEVLINML